MKLDPTLIAHIVWVRPVLLLGQTPITYLPQTSHWPRPQGTQPDIVFEALYSKHQMYGEVRCQWFAGDNSTPNTISHIYPGEFAEKEWHPTKDARVFVSSDIPYNQEGVLEAHLKPEIQTGYVGDPFW